MWLPLCCGTCGTDATRCGSDGAYSPRETEYLRSMSRPSAMAFDAAGNLYFADQANCAVRRVDATTGIITTVAGHPPCDTYSYTDPLGMTATDAHLSYLGGLAVDSSGIYVSEPDTCRIDKISSGVIERYAGAPPSGPPWKCTADGDGPALTQHLDEIHALAIDDDGNLLFDGGPSCAIRKVSGGMVSTVTANACSPYLGSDIMGFAQGSRDVFLVDDSAAAVSARCAAARVYDIAGVGSPVSLCGLAGDDGLATEAKLDNPAGVALDGAGNLYIADLFNNRVRVVYGADLDTDADGIDDASEAAHSCLDLYTADATDDADSDGLDNLTEVLDNTDPCSADTDDDGLLDPFEVAHTCLDPQLWDWTEGDWDSDGLTNLQEQNAAPTPVCRTRTETRVETVRSCRKGWNPTDPWDFYNVPVPALFSAPDPTVVFKDGAIGAGDAQAVFAYFKKAAKSGSTEYEQDLNENGIRDGLEYDRSVAGGPGQSGAPDGVVSASDAQLAFAQFKRGYHC